MVNCKHSLVVSMRMIMDDNRSSAAGVFVSHKKESGYYCCVPQCRSNARYDLHLSFHHIPKDELLKKQWIIKIRRDEGPHFKVNIT